MAPLKESEMNRINRLVRSAKRVGMTFTRDAKRNSGLFFCAIGSAVLLASLSAGIMPAGALDPGVLPTGGRIVSGQGSITSSGNQMTITQKQSKMIANWDTFNIGPNAGVTFRQPSASATALNWILDQNPSQIFGSLKSNGEVFLINPSGIIFGPTSRLDVGGLVASSLKLSDKDYLFGNFRFTDGGIAGSVINQGTINAANYGVVALIAPQVSNQGTITAPRGSVALASGNRVSLDFVGDGLIKVSVDEAALNAAVENSGAIRADGGKVLMTAESAGDLMATVVNNTGVVEANSVTERNGVIVLDGGSQGVVSNSGSISAKGINAGETGGTITLTGDKVGLFSGSNIDASGYSGGGTVNIGGGWHGANPNIRNANAVYMDPNSRIAADAIHNGNGGTVVLWSENYTNFRGSISARGGSLGGNGGQVETSSRNVLDAFGSVTTFAPKGNVGNWLLDPSDVYISSEGSGSLTNGVYDTTGSVGYITPSTILAGLAGGNVTIQTHAGSGGNGDITVQDSINTTGNLGGTRTLTLQADRDITVNAGQSIDATTGGNSSPLNVVLWSNYGLNGGSILMNPGSKINSNGGNITLGGGADITTGYAQGRDGAGDYSNGINLVSAQLYSDGGDITLRGRGANLGAPGQIWDGATGVMLGVQQTPTSMDTIIDSGSGKISITGVGALTSGWQGNGIDMMTGAWGNYNSNTVTIRSTNSSSSAITILGDASASTSTGCEAAGILLEPTATIEATNGGGISLTGRGGYGGFESNAGIVSFGDSNILANSGPISITGTRLTSSGTYSSALVFTSGWETSAANFGQKVGSSVTSSSSNITFTADTMSLDGTFQTSGILTIQPKTPSTTIGIGSGSVGTLNIDNIFGDWKANGSFAGGIVIGRSDGTGAITIGTGVALPTNFTVLNTGAGSAGITLDGSITADGNITLATAGSFTNNVGAGALTVTGGRWLVYSANPSLDTMNGLVANFVQYNAPYPNIPTGTGDGFLYSAPAPVPTPSPSPSPSPPPAPTGANTQAALTSTQTTVGGTGSILGNTATSPEESLTEGQEGTGSTTTGTSGAASTGSTSQTLTASNFSQQGATSQTGGDFGNAAVNFREAANLLLQKASLPQAVEAIELMDTAELQDYYQDGAITADQTRKTRLKDLRKDTAVVYTLIFPHRLDLVLATRSGLKKFSIQIDATALSQDINRLRASLQRRSRWDYLPEAQRFYNLIIKPLELELIVKGINTVIFIPDGALRTVPFAALHDGSRFLIEKYAVVVSPGLNLTDRRMILRKDTRVLSAGLTESVQGFAPLSNVKDELDGIQGMYRADRLENSTFIEGKVRENLKDNPYSIVHIATHGNFAPKASDTFLLAWDSRIDMNQLDQLIKQSASRKNPVELLCLSACETAAGDDRAALGLAGVAVKAGARSALATLWSVNDQASSELVLEFYKQLQNPGVTKAEALQAAQLMLLDNPRYRHPYYWSPFLLIGNWL